MQRAIGSTWTGARAAGVQWAALLALSAGFVVLLEAAHLPAALLLGPMLAGIALGAADTTVRVPGLPFRLAQAVIGCLMARAITPTILAAMLHDWPLLVAVISAVIGASGALGWVLARLRVLPGTTAVWGCSPGAASAMVLMAEAFGADVRLVAFMQYLRVVLVSATATLVARLWAVGGGRAPVVDWFPPIAWPGFAETLALVMLGAALAPRLRLPAGPLLLPLFVGVALAGSGAMTVVLPPWLLAASYAAVGWSIGLRFNRAILRHALRLLPRVVASIVLLIGLCGAVAAVLVQVAGVDPLTAYLATSPGGADSVAIIAASSNVDLPFVMALQTARFIVVLLVSPSLARFIARRAGGVADPAWRPGG
jgi:membrane AbrB-like protein